MRRPLFIRNENNKRKEPALSFPWSTSYNLRVLRRLICWEFRNGMQLYASARSENGVQECVSFIFLDNLGGCWLVGDLENQEERFRDSMPFL